MDCLRTLRAGAAIAACLVVTGCVTKSYIRRGDPALGAGNPEIAWEYYRRALSRNPELGADPLFAANMKRAAYESAVVRGRKLAGERNWDAAIAEFSKALEVDPNGAVASRELQKTRLAAAEDAYNAAVSLADAGNADEARNRLRRCLEFNPAAERARRALAAMDAPGEAGTPAAREAYARGLEAARNRRWDAAQAEFDRAVRSDETHFPSRLERRRALETLARVVEEHEPGFRRLRSRHVLGSPGLTAGIGPRRSGKIMGILLILDFHVIASLRLKLVEGSSARAAPGPVLGSTKKQSGKNPFS